MGFRALVFLLVLTPLPSRAGDFCGSITGPQVLRMLERYAAHGGAVEFHIDCIEQSFGDPLRGEAKTRVEVACTRALALPADRRDPGVDGYCVATIAETGAGKVGERDLVAELMARGGEWDAPPAYELLAATGDPRVRPFVLEALARGRAGWAKQRKRPGWALDQWARHKARALRALERVGVAADVALIDELAAEKPADKRVIKAAAAARAAASAR